MIVLFVIGYIGIASEHVLHINKATFALILCGLLWSIYALYGNDANLSADMITALGDTCEIVVFLIGAMTIVELIDRYGGFNIIVHRIRAKHKRRLLWVLSLMAFSLSAILDNMTTTIIMVMMLRRMLADQKERWIFACVIVLAANAGGAWSPIGDITTIMLWMKNYVSSADLIANLLIPRWNLSTARTAAQATTWRCTTTDCLCSSSYAEWQDFSSCRSSRPPHIFPPTWASSSLSAPCGC